MKLTKGMKKALSLLLSAAMVVTGVNVTANTASAADGDAATHKIEIAAAADANGTTEVKFDGEATDKLTVGFDAENNLVDVKFGKDLRDEFGRYGRPMIKVADLSEGATLTSFSSANGWGTAVQEKKQEKDAEIDYTDVVASAEYTMTDWHADGAVEFKVTPGATVELTVYDADPENAKPAPTEDPEKTPETTPEPTIAPDENTAFLMFADSTWTNWANWNTKITGGNGNDAVIDGNGTYTVSIDKTGFPSATASDGIAVFNVDIIDIANTQKFDASNMAITDVVVKADGKEVKTNLSDMYEGTIEYPNGNYRLEICNGNGWDKGDFTTTDKFEEANPDFSFEESLSVTFTIKGIKEGVTPEHAFDKPAVDEDGNPILDENGNQTYTGVVAVGGERAKALPADPTPAPTATTPAKTTTGSQITTKPAITTPAAVGTAKITPAQKTVVVAPGKSVKVGFTAKAAKPATKAAVVTATTASKKVATVKVNGKKVTIKAPKKAVKGASTTVTLKSTNGDKKVSAKIKVYVRNSAKKVKAAKKAITVKKGKTTKLVIKASKVQNKKKAFADTISVKGKILKLTNVKYAKGKATLTLKGAKKAKKKAVTIKVGKKSVKVKATVK